MSDLNGAVAEPGMICVVSWNAPVRKARVHRRSRQSIVRGQEILGLLDLLGMILTGKSPRLAFFSYDGHLDVTHDKTRLHT